MKLVIVESPAKAKTIRKYLGEDFEVLPSVGHIRDLPSSERDAIDMENGFAPNYTVLEGKEKVIGQIIEVSERSSKVFLATDPDREGESIAWHIKEVAGIKNAKRIVFNEITEDAVKKALRSPRDIDENLKEAQETRRVLDRLFGYTLSKLIWQKVRYGLSAGRVQSPALRILMERERERRKFNPVSFWNIKATLKDAHGFIYEAVDENNIAKRQDAEEMVKKGKNAKWIVESILECPRKRSANPPFITSTLQQVSNTRLNYSPANTMRIAQKLYEDGHITYMRTDSARISDQFQVQLKAFIEKEFGETEYQKNEFKKKSKIAQDAHEAVRPTDIKKKSAGSTDDQKKLYGLIWSRTSASHMKDAETLSTTIKFTAKDEKIPDLIMRGNKIKYLGWLAADPGGKGEETVLPDIDKDGVFSCESIEHIEKETEPPHRYSEAGLVKELEKRGIGRPSTYAATIKTLVDRVYVEKEGRTLVPTDTGDVVSTFLEKHFKAYIADKFTADMEDELDAISVGKQNYKSFLTDFYYPFFDSVDKKRNIEKLTTLGKAPEKYRCRLQFKDGNEAFKKWNLYELCPLP